MKNNLRASAGASVGAVLSILVILVLLVFFLLPVVNGRSRRDRKIDAKVTVINATTAIGAYYTEYGKYPPLDHSEPTTDMSTDEAHPKGNANLFYILRAIDAGINANHAFNPKKIVFVDGKDVADPANPKNGFSTAGETKGNLMDPWGRPYIIVLDYNNNKSLENLKYSDFSGEDTKPKNGVGAYSLGKDGVLGVKGAYRSEGKVSDDVLSWK